MCHIWNAMKYISHQQFVYTKINYIYWTFSNGASLSPSSRYHAGSSLDKSHHLDQLDTSMERLHSSKQIMDTSIDRFNSSKHGMDMSIDRTHTAKHHMDTSLNGVSRSSTSSPGRPSTSSPGRPSTSSPGRPSTSSPGRPHGAARLSTTQNMCSPGRSHSMARLLTSSVGSGSPSRSSLLRSTASSQDSGRSYSRECGDLHGALEESEQRRQLLVDRLRDAQDTIKVSLERIGHDIYRSQVIFKVTYYYQGQSGGCDREGIGQGIYRSQVIFKVTDYYQGQSGGCDRQVEGMRGPTYILVGSHVMLRVTYYYWGWRLEVMMIKDHRSLSEVNVKSQCLIESSLGQVWWLKSDNS